MPEHVINSIESATMMSVVLPNGERLYCVRDWVYWVSKSKATDRSVLWSDLKKSIENEGFKVSEILRVLGVETPGIKNPPPHHQRCPARNSAGVFAEAAPPAR